ncbi:MAG: DUF1080 domain-containing protein [Bryobacterales bacterium]|nr:DUF1080 domain-containing protein [Bryobacterales bacterium]
MRAVILVLACAATAPVAAAADWRDLLRDGLDGWEALGDGHWRIRSDGVVVASSGIGRQQELRGREDIRRAAFVAWSTRQSWLYTEREFGEFDLHLEYWVNTAGNSGVSIRDPSRAACGIAEKPDFACTPSKQGYEIQINSGHSDRWPTGSLYGLARARPGLDTAGEWNRLNIESRADAIRVYVNGVLAAEHAGDPERPRKGPIGLQLHDIHSFAMFRNIWVLEY